MARSQPASPEQLATELLSLVWVELLPQPLRAMITHNAHSGWCLSNEFMRLSVSQIEVGSTFKKLIIRRYLSQSTK